MRSCATFLVASFFFWALFGCEGGAPAEVGAQGGSGGVGAAGGDGGGHGGEGGKGGEVDCEKFSGEHGTSFVAVDVDDEWGDLRFSIDGCEVEPRGTDGVSCDTSAAYYLRIPSGHSRVVVESPERLRWVLELESREGECSLQSIRINDVSSMIMAFGIGEEGALSAKFPVEVFMDGKSVGAIERIIDEDRLQGLLLGGGDLATVLPELFRMKDDGMFLVLPINDAPHVIEFSENPKKRFRTEIPYVTEGWISIAISR